MIPPPVYVQAPPQKKSSGLKILLWLGLAAAGIVFIIFIAAVFFKAGQQVVNGGSDASDSATSDISSIQAVLKQDDAYRSSMQSDVNAVNIQSTDDIDRIAGMIRDYVTNGRGIDTQSCPRDFAEAYSRYLSAWTDAADTVSAHPDIPQGDDAVVYGFLRGLDGDPTGGAVQLQDDVHDWEKSVQSKQAEVDQAQGDLNALAVRYGAK